MKLMPVVMSGGSGTRLWPLSRATFPKQFCDFMDESLMARTLKRVASFGSPWILTVRELETLSKKVFREARFPAEQILFEPSACNTAPAIAMLCQVMKLRGNEDQIAAIFPADHLIMNEPEFGRALKLAESCASDGYVATLGITPDYPATGFGYIETKGEPVKEDDHLSAFSVAGFREKPSAENAKHFLEAGGFSWNAGIFVFQIKTMIAHFERLMPQLWQSMSALKADMSNLGEIYKSVEKISFDYGIMEKLDKQLCIPCSIGWSDLGSWDDVARFSEPPYSLKTSNAAEVVKVDSDGCFVFSTTPKVVGVIGIEDVIVVETPDALLITKRGRSQEVRSVVEQLNQKSHPVAREHKFEVRPWGGFKILEDEKHFKSKVITVDPDGQLSYQSHTQRAEHWIIVRGKGEVIIDDIKREVKIGDSIYVPTGAKHRIRNTGATPLEFVEVQTGSYFGEDDIVRYQDDYMRVPATEAL